MTELLRVSTAEATTTRPDGGSGMTDESGQAVGELVQEYVRLKWKRAGPPVRARTIGQHLGQALRSRIDVLGTDGEQLLEVRPSAVMQKIEELEQQAALEDRGVLEQASRARLSAQPTTLRSSKRTFCIRASRRLAPSQPLNGWESLAGRPTSPFAQLLRPSTRFG